MGDPVTAGVALGGSAVLGAQQQKKLKTANKNQKKELQGLNQNMGDVLEAGLSEQFANILKGNKASLKGYDSLEKDADRIEGQGILASKDFFNQAVGGVNAGAASRGMLGSSIQQNQRVGVARTASRFYTDAQLAASRLRSSAIMGRAGAEAENFGRLGSFAAYRANSRNALFSKYYDFVANQQNVASAPDLTGIAALVSSFKKSGTPQYNEGYGGA